MSRSWNLEHLLLDEENHPIMIRLLLISLYLLTFSGFAEELNSNPSEDLFLLAQLTYQEAEKEQNEKEAKLGLELAEKQFSQYIEKFPKNEHSSQAYFFLGACQTKLKKDQEANKAYVEVLKRTNQGKIAGAAALKLGVAQYQHQEYESAIQYLNLAVDNLTPSKSRTYAKFVIAMSNEKIGNIDELLAAAKELINDKSATEYHNRAHLLLANHALQEKDLLTAYKHYKVCIEDKNEEIRAQAVQKCAQLAAQLGGSDAALEYLVEILDTPSLKELHPSSALVLMSRASKGKLWDKVTSLEQYGDGGLKKEQKNQRLLLLAQAFDKQEKQEKATKYYDLLSREAEGTKTGFEVSYLRLSTTPVEKVSMNQIEKFLFLYKREFEQETKYASVQLLRAEKLYQDEKFEQATAGYDAIDLDRIDQQNVPTILYRLCKIAIESEDLEQSISYIAIFQREFPNDPRGAFLEFDKASLFSDSDKLNEAIEGYEAVLTHPQANRELKSASLQFLGKGYLKKELYEKSVGAYDNLLLQYTSGITKSQKADWYFWLAFAQYKQKLHKSAEANFKEARNLDKKNQKIDCTKYLALIAFTEKDHSLLKDEVANYEKLKQPPLPSPIYMSLALNEAKEKNWEPAWQYFQSATNTDELLKNSKAKNSLLETYAEVALETNNLEDTRAVSKALKSRDLPPYRRALNLYHLALAENTISGAKVAQAEAEEAILINPSGDLKYKLLLLAGTIEVELENVENGSRLLKQVAYFAGDKNQALKKAALKELIKTVKTNPDSEAQKQYKEYQKELKQLK